jgi:hypothetical protein
MYASIVPMKNKSPCVECGKPTTPPKGNWNAKAVVLCHRAKCRRKRKTALQKTRRSQRLIEFLTKPEAEKLITRIPLPKKKPTSAKKRAFYGQNC